jgi:hypothetical protein
MAKVCGNCQHWLGLSARIDALTSKWYAPCEKSGRPKFRSQSSKRCGRFKAVTRKPTYEELKEAFLILYDNCVYLDEKDCAKVDETYKRCQNA